jgi:hypothetical protein
MHDFSSRLDAAGVTGDAKNWVIKALDPACATTCAGLPDTSNSHVLRPEYRAEISIGPSSTAGTWDCIIWSPPGDVNTLYYATAPQVAGPVDFSLGAPPANSTYGSLKLQPSADVPGTSRWYTFPAATLASVSIRANATNPSTFRHIYKSLTIDLVAAAVTDQGSVWAAQVETEPRNARMRFFGSNGSTSTGAQLVSYFKDFVLPLNEADLTQSGPNFYMGKAKDGVYVPLKLTGSNQPFANVDYQVGSMLGTLSGVTTILLPDTLSGIQFPQTHTVVANDSGGATAPWIQLAVYGATDGANSCDTGFDNMNTAVVIFRGLAGPASGGFGSTLLVKALIGLEIIPRPTSTDRVYTELATEYSPRAMEAYYGISERIPDAFPASYNSWQAIIPVLAQVATRLWPYLKQGLGLVASSTGESMVRRVLEVATRARPGRSAVQAPRLPQAAEVTYRAAGGRRRSESRSRASSRQRTPRAPSRARGPRVTVVEPPARRERRRPRRQLRITS